MNANKIVCLMTAALAAVTVANAQLIDNFNSNPNVNSSTAVTPETTGWQVQGDSANISWYEDGGVDNTGWLEMKRSWWNNQQVLGIWIDTSGLSAGQTYFLQFDYTVGLAGSGTHNNNATLNYSVGENNGGTGWNNRVANLANNPRTMEGTSEFILEQIAGPTVNQTVAWTTYTSTEGFSFDASSTRLWIEIATYGFGLNASSVGDNYSYFGLDNVQIIPEPSTIALVGILLGSSFLFLRRKK